MAEEKEKSLKVNQETIDILVANVIPTTKYFELRFDQMDKRTSRIERDMEQLRDEMKQGFAKSDQVLNEFKTDVAERFGYVDKRFEQVDKRFEQVDKRFEQVDKRFEQVDKRFEQVDKKFELVIASIDKLGDKIDNKLERGRDFTLRMFSIAIMISFLGVFGVLLKMFGVF